MKHFDPEHLVEKTIHSEIKYEGFRLTCKKDLVELPDGKKSTRDVVDHPQAVSILPILDNGNVCLVQQYRYAIQQLSLEIPAGCIDPGEDPLSAAKRELQEETGYLAKNWTKLTAVYLAPGFCNEFMHIYLATDLTMTQQNLDPDEVVNCVECSFSQFETWIKEGQISDGKTCVAYGLSKDDFGNA